MSFSLRAVVSSNQPAVPAPDETSGGRVWRVFVDVFTPLRAASGYSLVTALGLALGFARELTVASEFGLSPQLDVFVAVMSVHLFFGVQVGNAFEAAFISKVPRSSGVADISLRLRRSIGGLLLMNVAILLVLVFTSDAAIQVLFPNFDTNQHSLALRIIQLLLLPIAFSNIAGLMRGGLNVLGKFAPGFFAGSVISATTIVSVLMFASELGVDALVFGYAAGHFLVLVVFAARLMTVEDVTAVRPHRAGGGMWYLWGAAGGVLIGEVLYQAVVLTERGLAATLPTGSLTAFYYASTIVSVPLSLAVVPLTTTLFPRLVELFGKERRAGLQCLLRNALLLMGLSLGLAVVVSVFASPIVETVFVRGRFTVEHAQYTAGILAVTIWALPFMSMGRLLKASCYSLQEYRVPAVAVGGQAVALLALGVMLVPRYGAVGLAIAFVCAEATMMVTMTLLFLYRLRGA